MKIYLALMLIMSVSVLSEAEGENLSLKFLVSGKIVKEVSLSTLKDKLKTHEIEFYDPIYEKKKRYKGFDVRDVLQLGFGDEWKNSDYTDIAFEALDGYAPISAISKLRQSGGYVVFSDLDFEDWEPISIKQVNPGPFYLVWTGKNQTNNIEYPWPWQLSSINLIKFQDQYPAVYPKGASKDSPAFYGYEIFKGRCIRCHSMNQQGSKVGPDLNAPQSIVSYRSEFMIKELIKHPSKYRYTQMPDHPDLSDQDLDNTLAYFSYMNEIRD